MNIDLGNNPVGAPPTTAEAIQIRLAIGADIRTDANGAFSAGDLGGNARGENAINIQPSRFSDTRIASAEGSIAIGKDSLSTGGFGDSIAIGTSSTASDSNSIAIGTSSTASGNASLCLGVASTANGDFATATGYNVTAAGNYATVSGYLSTASGYRSTALGYSVTAIGDHSSVIGNSVKTTIDKTSEIGYWAGSTRGGAVRTHSTGMVVMTIQNRATAYGDGGATAGSEADNTIIREGISLRRNGNEILIDLNIAGTVTTLSLGTAA